MPNDPSVNLFQLPTDPEQFTVLLPPAVLRKLDFTALDFPTARKAVVEYIKTYFPNDFNDFASNNGIIMLVELCSFLTAALSLREDILANEGFLPVCQTEDAVVNHLALIGQQIQPATPAIVDIECIIGTPLAADVHINPGTSQPFEIRGEDGTSIFYEVFSAPDDLTSDIIIPAGKRGVIAFGLEGRTIKTSFTVDGTPDTVLPIRNLNILSSPITVQVQLGINGSTEQWEQIDVLQRAGASDKVFEARLLSNQLQIVFGDNITGRSPAANSLVTVIYRVGGGVRGRIGAGVINIQRAIPPQYPYTAPTMVSFRNLLASAGGIDKESLDSAKKRAPRDFATQGAAVTATDYAQLASSFSHPTFGAVSKAIATVRTGFNANAVEVYILAAGPGGTVVQPTPGLRRALATYLDDINVITDNVIVLGGCIRPVDLKMTVVMSKNADASIVKTNVEATVTSFFDLSNWDMGQGLYVSRIIELLNKIDGVAYVDVFSPADNILSSTKLCSLDSTDINGTGTGTLLDISSEVGINEVITLGDREIAYYYESSGRN